MTAQREKPDLRGYSQQAATAIANREPQGWRIIVTTDSGDTDPATGEPIIGFVVNRKDDTQTGSLSLNMKTATCRIREEDLEPA